MNNTRNHLIIGVVCVAILIASLVAYLMISNKGEEEIQMQDFATEEGMVQEQENVTTNEEESKSASTEMGKTVEESKKEIEETEKAKDTTNKSSNEISTESEKTASKKENKTEEKEEKSNNKEPEFNMPIQGEILREFASETLVYSNTLQEWVTHNGIDIKADKTSVVSASASGTVYAIKNDPRYGLTVIINHNDGYQTVYSNLLTAEFVVEGEKVDAGQTIGTVGNSASFEVSDDYHLHFEILKDNQYVDPTTIIN